MSYVIEDGIPLPVTSKGSKSLRGPRTELTTYLDKLLPKQSMLLSEYPELKAAQQFAYRANPRRFAFRKNRDGWRIWRTE